MKERKTRLVWCIFVVCIHLLASCGAELATPGAPPAEISLAIPDQKATRWLHINQFTIAYHAFIVIRDHNGQALFTLKFPEAFHRDIQVDLERAIKPGEYCAEVFNDFAPYNSFGPEDTPMFALLNDPLCDCFTISP